MIKRCRHHALLDRNASFPSSCPRTAARLQRASEVDGTDDAAKHGARGCNFRHLADPLMPTTGIDDGLTAARMYLHAVAVHLSTHRSPGGGKIPQLCKTRLDEAWVIGRLGVRQHAGIEARRRATRGRASALPVPPLRLIPWRSN